MPWRALYCLSACTFDVSVLCPDVLIISLDQPGFHILSLTLLITFLVLCLDQPVLLYPTYCFCIYFFYRFLFSSFLSPFSYMSYLWYMIPIGLNIDLALCHRLLHAPNLGINEKQPLIRTKVLERQRDPIFIYIEPCININYVRLIKYVWLELMLYACIISLHLHDLPDELDMHLS